MPQAITINQLEKALAVTSKQFSDALAVTVEQIKELVDQRLGGLEDKITKRLDNIDQRFDGVDKRFDCLEKKMDHGFSTVHQRIDGLSADLNEFREENADDHEQLFDRLDTIEKENHMRDRDIRVLKEKVGV